MKQNLIPGRVLFTVLSAFLFSPLLAATLPTQNSADEWAQVQGLLSNIKGVATAPIPNVVTSKYTAGMLLGNGDVGVVIGGPVDAQKFYFSKGDFIGVYYNQSKTRWENSYLAIGSMTITSAGPSADAAATYRMEQDILNAEVRTKIRLGGATVNMRSWTADAENVFVTELTSEPASPPVTITVLLDETVSDIFPNTCGTTNGVLWVTRENDNRTDVKSRVALALKPLGASLDDPCSAGTAISGNLTLQPGVPVTLVLTVKSDTKSGGQCAGMTSLRDSAIAGASEMTLAQIAKLHAEHLAWWKDFWLKSYVQVHDEVLEKYYYGALYVLGCAARPGKTLPSMWGLWITNDSPGWGGRHFCNYNAQAPYYGAASSNRPELILPYSELMMAELPYQVNATHAAGYKGTTWRRSYAPFELFRPKPAINPVAPAKDYKRLQTDQKSNNGFAVAPMIMYYDYTQDKTFLKEKLYPFLKEVDAFWRDFMEREDLPGGGYRYVVRHTGAHEVSNAEDVNPNLDVGYARMTFRKLIDYSRELGVDAEMIPIWQETLDHLSQYPTCTFGGKECFVECEVRAPNITDPNNLMHRTDQPINMEGAVHPGENVTLGGDPHWIQVGLNTYAYMDAWGLSGRSMNNAFCKVWPQAVRLGWPADDFFNKFKASIKTLWRESNLTCFQGGGGIETSGSIDAVNSMLLQSNFEELRLFPVWPKNKDASFKRLRAKGAFVVSSAFKDGQVRYVEVLSEKGRPLKMVSPWTSGTVQVFETSGDLREPVSYKRDGDFITFRTTAGGRYTVALKEPSASPVPAQPRAAGEGAGLVKNPVLPPKWAFGVLFGCYYDQAKVLDTMQRLRNGYCGDLLWVDSSWLSGDYTDRGQNHYIDFKFDPTQFPDPKAMIAALHQNHFKFGVWEWPYIERSITELYEYGQSHKYFITDKAGGEGNVVNGGGWHGVKFSGQIDFTNPAAAEWFKQLNQPLLDMGVDFFKIDTYSTPAKGGVLSNGGGTDDLRRLYHKTVYEITAKTPDGRGFYLAHRMGNPDNDQYPGMWTGDTRTSWAGFEDEMKRAAALNTPNTAAYWCGDTGGYNGDVQGDELYIRWLQYGCFTPVTEFFSAKGAKGRFPWVFGEEGQRIFKIYTTLRYRLLPFRYSNAQIGYHESPVQYPVRFVPGRTDELIVGSGDSEILVAPIHNEGATSGDAHLPQGKPWINYWTGEVYAGGTVPVVAAPIDKVPLFVKAGAIIPMGPEMDYVDQKPANPLTLDIYPSGKTGYTLYEDDGRSNDYKNGKFSRTVLACDATGQNAIVEIGAAQGDYDGKLASRTYLLKINHKVASLSEISRNGVPMKKLNSKAALEAAEDGWFNDAENSVVWAKFTASTSDSVKIAVAVSN